ncbi:MAG: hypothetical protein GF392_00500 [Candidatus Omnitrophica bacterium]|nr:hypothetical protein [Candidatus Omnitrophota bacterium]
MRVILKKGESPQGSLWNLYCRAHKRNPGFDAIFLGGGTLIGVPAYLRKCRDAGENDKPFIVFGTGVRAPDFWREYPDKSFWGAKSEVDISKELKNWVNVLGKAIFLGVRGPLSKKVMDQYIPGKAEVIGDPALSLCKPGKEKTGLTGKIAVNVADVFPVKGSVEKMQKEIVQIIRAFVRTGHSVVLMPVCWKDLRLSKEIAALVGKGRIKVWEDFIDLRRTIEEMKSCDFMVGTRLHSVVCSCGVGVPTISINYRPKCRDFMASMGEDDMCLDIEDISLERIEELKKQIYKEYYLYRKRLIAKGDEYRQLQRGASRKIMASLLGGS